MGFRHFVSRNLLPSNDNEVIKTFLFLVRKEKTSINDMYEQKSIYKYMYSTYMYVLIPTYKTRNNNLFKKP